MNTNLTLSINIPPTNYVPVSFIQPVGGQITNLASHSLATHYFAPCFTISHGVWYISKYLRYRYLFLNSFSTGRYLKEKLRIVFLPHGDMECIVAHPIIIDHEPKH